MPEKGKTFAGEVREETVAWSKDTYQLLKQAEQGKVKSYVQDIALAVLDCKETATSRETFIRLMNERGYGVDWQDSHKYITYTDLAREQAGEKACKIRDNKLEKYYNMDFGKESMEHEFERNARTAEAEQSKRAASRVKPTEPDRAGKQSAQRSVGDVERELRGIDEAVKSRTSEGRAEQAEEKLVSGLHCEPETVKEEMQATKELWGKTDGRTYKHYVQSYHEDEEITPEQAHKNAVELAEHTKAWKGHEVLIATHIDKGHIHTHFIVNSVNYENGHKLQWM